MALGQGFSCPLHMIQRESCSSEVPHKTAPRKKVVLYQKETIWRPLTSFPVQWFELCIGRCRIGPSSALDGLRHSETTFLLVLGLCKWVKDGRAPNRWPCIRLFYRKLQSMRMEFLGVNICEGVKRMIGQWDLNWDAVATKVVLRSCEMP